MRRITSHAAIGVQQREHVAAASPAGAAPVAGTSLGAMVTEADLELGGGRRLHLYDTGGGGLAVLWQHGTPNLGAPPEPLFPAAGRLGLRLVSYDRPGYGGSTPRPGRDVASAAADAAAVVDTLGVGRFTVMGHSGGGSHALACGALLGERVLAVVCASGLAPFRAEGLDWFAGMAAAGAADLRAAARGRAALQDHLATVGPWGFDPAQVRPPVLFLHGGQDRIAPSAHAGWLARHTPSAELWRHPDDGHVSVLNHAAQALTWLRDQAGRG
jgi:pimeloyl-ACP methyl ester carboxylesterase